MHIDWWTLALQTVNVLILVWILGRFFFRPVTAIVAKRQEAAKKLLSDASSIRHQAEEARSQADKARAELDAQRLRFLDQSRQEAMAEKARLLDEASRDLAKMREAAAAAAERDRVACDSAMMRHAGELSLEIARRLLSRVPPDMALQTFAEELCREVRSLPDSSRAGLISMSKPGGTIEVLTATDLSDEQKQYLRRKLVEALGAEVPMTFRRDETLMVGLELRGPTTVVRNSWRSDLERIREELTDDGRLGKT
ncbi:F-type H+-transporting ATPase subunit b [Enhydrobacter aerosaccus]|uniref:ATP synthase subunit b n=1 Tax=Enhydrobacter aerosaccus TaxID=225324 RepID=A0A1T4SAU7_9HYPH|nr:F0F1 ATP synthase subunit delta [Enhydrobacter aerosaccus]SKA25440.1 F-type H+-transporting ATPase subunit b [Enhydrobacter aerosaccus]